MTNKVQRGTLPARIAIYETLKNHLFANGDGTFRYSNNHTDATLAEYVADNAVHDEKGDPLFGPVTGAMVKSVRQEMFGPLRAARMPNKDAARFTQLSEIMASMEHRFTTQLHADAEALRQILARLDRIERTLRITT